MHDSGAPGWLKVVEKHHSALIDELISRVDSELREAVVLAVAAENASGADRIRQACLDASRDAGREARRSQAEALNQTLRRIRTGTPEGLPALLAEGCAPFAEQVVVLVFESNQACYAAGFDGDGFDLEAAPAILAAIESRDPMVAIATDSELSASLAAALGNSHKAYLSSTDTPKAYLSSIDTPKAYLFPITARQSVMAMLVASGVELSAPIELLCGAAGMRLDTAAQSPSRSEPLIQLAADVPASETSPARSWDELSPEDQRLHLQAQRTARVRVAEIRLDHAAALRTGADTCDIYGALRAPIDAARDQFLHTFLSKSSTMVDYLHLEVLRSLAHGDERMLGHGYPGPMV